MTTMIDPNTKLATPTVDQASAASTTINAATAANDDGFDDEVLVLPEKTESLNRMGMDTISCIGCQ